MTTNRQNIDKVLRVCIGTEPKTAIPCKVLQYSIQKHLSPAYQVEFHLMQGESWRSNPTLGQGTGFSLLRWQIPEYLQYSGLSLYLDADQLVFGDIYEVFALALNDLQNPNRPSVYCTFQKDKWFPSPPYAPNTSVMLIDCEKAKEDWPTFEALCQSLENDPLRKRYVQVMHGLHLKTPPALISSVWNQLNIKSPGCKLLHYTQEHNQPWYNPNHPNKDLWRDYLVESISSGVVTKQEIRLAVESFEPHTKNKRGTGMHPYWLKFAK